MPGVLGKHTFCAKIEKHWLDIDILEQVGLANTFSKDAY